jgi:hypothetical protein
VGPANGQPCTRQDSNDSNFRKLTAARPRLGLGQLEDHYHQNDNDQDTNNDPNDSSVHFSSFDSHAEVILGDKITSSAHPVRASTFLR